METSHSQRAFARYGSGDVIGMGGTYGALPLAYTEPFSSRSLALEDKGIIALAEAMEVFRRYLVAFITQSAEVPDTLQLPAIFTVPTTFKIVRDEPIKFTFIEE
jgi:hypothetical protein